MARRPRAQSKKSQSNLVTPLAVFVVLFIFSFGLAIYAYMSWRELDRKIYGSLEGASQFEELNIEGEEYFGYLMVLEEKHQKLVTAMHEKELLENVIGISHVERLGDKFAVLGEEINRIYESKGKEITFVEFVRQLADEKEAYKKRLENAEKAKEQISKERDKSQRELAAVDKTFNERITELQRAIRSKESQINQLQESHARTRTKLEKDIFEAKSRNQKQQQEFDEKLEKAEQDLAKVEKALKEIQSEKVGGGEFKPDYAEPDGIVLNVQDLGQACCVDIGLKHGAKVGLQFLVYGIGPGGKRREKGKIELKMVDPNISYAGMLSVKDELDPILPDDIVISPIFKRGEPTVFVLETDIDRPDRERIARKIEKYGNKVAESVSARTDFVVIKDMPGEMAAEADKWAVRKIRLVDVDKVLGKD